MTKMLTAAQVGEGLRRFTALIPPPGLPADLELDEVDWERVGAQIDQIMASTYLEL